LIRHVLSLDLSLSWQRAISAVVAQQLYTLLVGGSNPSSPTIRISFLSSPWIF
jgi:hypothetical protein